MLVKTVDSALRVPTSVDRFLARDPLINNVSIGVLANCREQPGNFPIQNFYFLEAAGEVVAYAHHTPPYPLSLSLGLPGAIQFLARSLAERELEIDALHGPTPLVEAFLEVWPALRKRRKFLELQGLYRLAEVIYPSPSGASFCLGQMADLEIALSWHKAFCSELKDSLPSDDRLRHIYETRIANSDFFLLRKGDEAVAMASATREMGSGRAVSFVYTPPEHRKRGYAADLVAETSAHLLAKGYEFCCLFTQLANKSSNRIYQRVGYVFTMEFSLQRFGGSAVAG